MNDSTQYENYAHKNSPNGHRYVGIKGHTPAWAVDVQDGDGKIRNALGLEAHVTDEYVHWSFSDGKKIMLEMRDIWERAESDRASSDDIRYMMDIAARYAKAEAAEHVAGADI